MVGRLAPKRCAMHSAPLESADMDALPLTVSEAIAYVQALEAKWNGKASRVISTRQNAAVTAAWDINTVFGAWVVWRDLNGRIYGEC